MRAGNPATLTFVGRAQFLAHVLLCLLGVVTLVACERRPPSPPQGSPRIVALSPAVAVMLKSLGREAQIVGRHASDLALQEQIPVCGDQNQIDLESLNGVHPTHVITQWGTRSLPERLTALAQQKGWILRDCAILSLDDIERELSEIDRLLADSPEGTPEGRAAAAHLRTALRHREGLQSAGRVLLLGGLNPPAALGPGSCHHDVLLRIGASPALNTGGAWQILSLEDLREIAPDAIVLVDPRSPRTPPARGRECVLTGEPAIARLGAVGRLDVPAVRRGRIAVIDDPLSLLPSTNMADFADQITEALEAWR